MGNAEAGQFDVVVVGGINQDFTSYAPRFPNPGESIRGHSTSSGFGGNGNNQSVMAARLGCKTAMVGKVGGDMFGKALIDNLASNGVNVDNVGITKDTQTGTAAVWVDDSGQNKVAFVLGANLTVSVEDVKKAEGHIAKARVLVCALELKEEVVLEALKIAKKHGVTTLFNVSPVPLDGLSNNDFYKYTDIICCNEHEAQRLVGLSVNTDADIDQALLGLIKLGAKTAIITLGKKGCVSMNGENQKSVRVTAPVVKAVDVTGAGDAFLGSLAYFISHCPHLKLEEQIRRSCQISAISVESSGTQSSYPKRDQLPKSLLE